MNPPAQGRPFTGVFGESEGAKAFAKRSVFGVGADFSDCVHIQRRARWACTLIRNEQACDGSSHKHKVSQHGTQ